MQSDRERLARDASDLVESVRATRDDVVEFSDLVGRTVGPVRRDRRPDRDPGPDDALAQVNERLAQAAEDLVMNLEALKAMLRQGTAAPK